MAKSGAPVRRDSVVCPYCGIFCDDLVLAVSAARIEVAANGCPLAIDSYAKLAAGAPPPRVAGRDTDLETACARAAEILSAAHLPLVGGLACDLAGIKSAMALAERIGGVVDHAASDAMFRNMLAMQDMGWMTATYAEIKNRADLVILAGTDAVSRFPRFFERFVDNPESLIEPKPARRIVYLGAAGQAAALPKGAEVIGCDETRLGEVFRALRAVYRGWDLQVDEVAGVPLTVLDELVTRIKFAKYGAIVWSAADMDGVHGELTVQAICDLVMDANVATRMSGVPLGGSDNILGAAGVSTWQAGFPLRVSFAGGRPDYDPYLYSWRRLIDSGEADAVLWISAFRPGDLPFKTKAPVVALAAPGSKFKQEPAVFIPVGTPGVDHAGHVLRGDTVASLPLHGVRDSALPAAAAVLAAIEARLAEERGAC